MSNCYDTKDVSSRLARIEGHVRGIKQMVEDSRACEDILLQIGAVKAALEKVGKIVLEGHLEGCILDGIKSGKGDEVIRQLKNTLDNYL